MKITDFSAHSDVVGRRIVVRWRFVMEAGETLAAIPPVVVRRKLRDFEFMPIVANDPTVVYDSTAFPPTGSLLTEIPGWEVQDSNLRHVTTVDSISKVFQNQPVEVQRRTITTTFDLNYQPVSQQVELIDTGAIPGELLPGTTYYYQIRSSIIDASENPARYRATVAATDSFNLARKLYEMIPSVYRRHDVRSRPVTPGTETIPEAAARSGQLRRFVDLFGASLDQLRSSAEGLYHLHDIDTVDYRYLPLMARWIGWDLNLDTTIPVQRNEIKSAPALYKGIGTVPNVRSLVNYYTGWFSQVAEFTQSIARSNQPSQFNLFAIEQVSIGADQSWRSPDDAALVFGWLSGNDTAIGSATNPATLTSGLSEPFNLRPGMKLLLSIDRGLPVMIQFGAKDFVAISQASAAEVSRVLNQFLDSATAIALSDGRILLQTYRRGGNASLEVRATNPELISLESAPQGKLSAILMPSSSVLRLFYDTMATDPDAMPASISSTWAQRRIRYKTYDQGVWRDSHALSDLIQGNHAYPAAAPLSSDRVLLTWIEQPDSSEARIRFSIGSPRSVQPAVLTGRIREPFSIRVGSRITFRRNHTTVQTLSFLASDFAVPEAATATEVATALNTRMTGIQAIVQPDRSLQILTTGATAEQLEIDLRQSDIAQELGFGSQNSVATGTWDDTLDWSVPETISMIPAGRYADLHSVVDQTGQGWLFWAQHDGAFWQLMLSRWNGATWTVPIALTTDLAHHREPCAIVENQDRIWLVWSQSQSGDPNQDRWLLNYRVLDLTTMNWGTAVELTADPGGQVSDRQPNLLLTTDGKLRIFFHSDRSGGLDLWSMDLRISDRVRTTPQVITQTGDIELAPTPIVLPDSRMWLLYRSEQNIPLNQSGYQPSDHSINLVDTGTLRHFHGSITVRPMDQRRNQAKRRWDDRLTYTPQQIESVGKTGALVGEQFYTLNTFGIYISRTSQDSPLTQRKIERLRQVLERSLPLNMRAVIILAPRVDVEYIYEAGTVNDIRETFRDDYPEIEYYDGLLDQSIVRLPDWIVILSNTLEHRTADPTSLTSLRLRTFFPPFE